MIGLRKGGHQNFMEKLIVSLLTCFVFVFQILCFCVWYQFIYQGPYGTASKFMRNAAKHLKIQIKYAFFQKKRGKKLYDFLEKNEDVIKRKRRNTEKVHTSALNPPHTDVPNEWFGFLYLIIVFSAFLAVLAMSSILSVMIVYALSILKVLFTVCYISAIAGLFVKYNRMIADFLNEYSRFMNSLFLAAGLAGRRSRYGRADAPPEEYQPFEVDLETIKRNVKGDPLFFILITASIVIGGYWMGSQLFGHEAGLKHDLICGGALAAVYFVLKFVDKDIREEDRKERQRRKEQRRTQRDVRQAWAAMEGIIAEDYLKEWEPDIRRMCGSLRIKRLSVMVSDSKTKSASSRKDQVCGLLVEVGGGYLERIRGTMRTPSEYHEAVAFLLGHEITHIYYKDYADKAASIKSSAIPLVILLLGICGIILSMKLRLLSETALCIIFLLLYFPCLIFFRILENERYWKQVSELRADRIGLGLSGASVKTAEKLLKMEAGLKKEDNLIKRVFDTYEGFDAHPVMELRCRELERGKPWGFGEYVRYLFILKAWRKNYLR